MQIDVLSAFDILAELLARDVDRTLLKRGMEKTPTARIEWLEQMQEFAEEARKARREAEGTPPTPR